MAMAGLWRRSFPLALQRGFPSLALAANTLVLARAGDENLVADYALVSAILAIVRIASDFGMERLLPRLYVTADSDIAGQALLARIITGLLGAAASAGAAWVITDNVVVVLVAAIIPLAQAPALVAVTWALWRERTHSLVYPSAVGFLVSILAPLTGIHTLSLVLLGVLGGATVESLLLWRAVKPPRMADLRPSAALPLLRQAQHFAIQSVIAIAYARIPVLMVGSLGASAVAAFAIGMTPYTALALAPASLAMVSYPRLALAAAHGDRPLFLSTTSRYMLAAAGFAVVAAFFGITADLWISGLYGTNYSAAADVARILMAALVLSSVNSYWPLALYAFGWEVGVARLSLASLCTLVVLIVVLRPYGPVAVSTAILATEGVALLLFATSLRRALRGAAWDLTVPHQQHHLGVNGQLD